MGAVLGCNRSQEFVAVRRGPAVKAIFASGSVEGTAMYPVAPRVSGRLLEILVDEGAVVAKGQVLGSLEDAHLVAKVVELQAREEYLRRELSRQDALSKTFATSVENLERIKSELLAIRSSIEIVKHELRYLKLIAAEGGTVIKRDGEIGQVIAAQQAVFWINSGALRVSAEVDEEDIPQVQTGMKVYLRSDAFPEKSFEGHVLQVTPKGDALARSFRVRIALPEQHPFLIGMTVEANIVVREDAHALLVPSTSYRNGYVWKRGDSGRATPIAVDIGNRGEQFTEITKGLTESDSVLVDPGREAVPQ